MLLSKNLTIFTVLTIILCYRYYDTEDFSSISIIVMLNITIHDNIVILPSPSYAFIIHNNLSVGAQNVTGAYVIIMLVYRCLLNNALTWQGSCVTLEKQQDYLSKAIISKFTM